MDKRSLLEIVERYLIVFFGLLFGAGSGWLTLLYVVWQG